MIMMDMMMMMIMMKIMVVMMTMVIMVGVTDDDNKNPIYFHLQHSLQQFCSWELKYMYPE